MKTLLSFPSEGLTATLVGAEDFAPPVVVQKYKTITAAEEARRRKAEALYTGFMRLRHSLLVSHQPHKVARYLRKQHESSFGYSSPTYVHTMLDDAYASKFICITSDTWPHRVLAGARVLTSMFGFSSASVDAEQLPDGSEEISHFCISNNNQIPLVRYVRVLAQAVGSYAQCFNKKTGRRAEAATIHLLHQAILYDYKHDAHLGNRCVMSSIICQPSRAVQDLEYEYTQIAATR